MSSSVLYGRIPIHIWELAKTKSVIILVWRVGKSVNDNRMGVCVVHFAHPTVQLVVGYAGPVHRFLDK